MKLQTVPKFTVICYLISLLLISVVMAEQFLEWQWLARKTKITLLIAAAIIGAAGSFLSLGRQLMSYFASNSEK